MSRRQQNRIVRFSVMGNKGLVEESFVTLDDEAAVEAKFIDWLHRTAVRYFIDFKTGCWTWVDKEDVQASF